MPALTFEKWFANLLGQSEIDVECLLRDRSAIRFLMAWSMFESRCFAGNVKADSIHKFAERITAKEGFSSELLGASLRHFHERYQDKSRYRALMHKSENERLSTLIAKPIESLKSGEGVFLVTFVVYRFRNNIFHGNKGVQSWLQYEEQIRLCTEVMQQLISHAEATAQRETA